MDVFVCKSWRYSQKLYFLAISEYNDFLHPDNRYF